MVKVNNRTSELEPVLRALYNQEVMSSSLKAALKIELTSDPTGRGYLNKTPYEIVHLMTSEYEIANPEPQSYLAKDYVEAELVRNVLLNHTMAETGKSGWKALYELSQTNDGLWDAYHTIDGYANAKQVINLENPKVSALFPILVSLGILTQDEANYLSLYADPNYQSTINMPCRADVVLGAGYVPELDEIEGALA